VDRDGDPDVLVSATMGWQPAGKPGSAKGHWLSVKLAGRKSNREGIGTRVVVTAGDRKQVGWVRSGCSYCFDSEHVARFGLGALNEVETVDLRWPSGIRQTVRNVKADQVLAVTEPAQ